MSANAAGSALRTLVITPMLPVQVSGDIGGKHRRAGAFLRAIGRLSRQVRLVYLVPDRFLRLAEDPARLNQTQSDFWGVPVEVSLEPRRTRVQTRWSYYGRGILDARQQDMLYPYGGDHLAARIGQHLDSEPDLVFADRIESVIPIIASGRRPSTMVLDVDDVYHKVLWRAAFSQPRRLGKCLTALQAPALVAAERRAIALSSVSFVCSAEDCAHLRRLGCGDTLHFVPNALPVPEAAPGLVTAPTVLYLGSFYHPPNVLAADRLIQRIWPLVRRAVPAARLLIAGGESERLVSRALTIPGVEYLGFVEDLAAVYGRARVVCCPITTGSGTRLKLVEAASFARPMVSTRLGAEGLAFRDGHDIMLRQTDADLAGATVTLLRSDALCCRLGKAALATMRTHYDVQRIEAQITGAVQRLFQHGWR